MGRKNRHDQPVLTLMEGEKETAIVVYPGGLLPFGDSRRALMWASYLRCCDSESRQDFSALGVQTARRLRLFPLAAIRKELDRGAERIGDPHDVGQGNASALP